MFGKLNKLQKESIMAGLYLGIAVTGLNALVAMGWLSPLCKGRLLACFDH
jgi:hypothetical protein